MKKVFLLTDVGVFNSMIRNLITDWHKKKFGIDDPSQALEMGQVSIKEYANHAKLRTDYPESLPENAIVFLGPTLAGESSKQIFDLFGPALKQRTVVMATDAVFAFEAMQAGFEQIPSRGGITISDVQLMVIKWLE